MTEERDMARQNNRGVSTNRTARMTAYDTAALDATQLLQEFLASYIGTLGNPNWHRELVKDLNERLGTNRIKKADGAALLGFLGKQENLGPGVSFHARELKNARNESAHGG